VNRACARCPLVDSRGVRLVARVRARPRVRTRRVWAARALQLSRQARGRDCHRAAGPRGDRVMPDPQRLERALVPMAELGVDALLLSVGPDLPYFTGYEAMPLERLTMFVLPQTGDPVLLVPRLEAPRVDEYPHLFAVETWDETEDPVSRVAAMTGSVARAA